MRECARSPHVSPVRHAVPGHVAPGLNGLRLRVVIATGTAGPFSEGAPLIPPLDDMDVLWISHIYTPLFDGL